MNIIQALILGIVEGITEFLPISSTFHLLLASSFMNLAQSDFVKLFEVFIQAGAIVAVILLYWRDVIGNRDLFLKLCLSFIPTAIVGLVLYKVIKSVFFESSALTTGVFVLVGVIFLIVEYLIQRKTVVLKKDIKKVTYKDAIIIGFVQALAVVPGVSRAGSVMVGMMLGGFKREDAAQYSFMLSVPTILAASLYDLYKMRDIFSSNSDYLGLLAIGSLMAFVSAYIVIRWLIGYLQRNTLVLFGWYRIAVGIILMLIAHP